MTYGLLFGLVYGTALVVLLIATLLSCVKRKPLLLLIAAFGWLFAASIALRMPYAAGRLQIPVAGVTLEPVTADTMSTETVAAGSAMEKLKAIRAAKQKQP